MLGGDEGSNPPKIIPVWRPSLVGLPGWSELGAVSAGKIQATGTPGGQIWGCVTVGSISRAKSLFSGLPLFLSRAGSWGRE